MEKALGVVLLVGGLLIIYVVIAGRLPDFLAALTAPSMVQVGKAQ